MNNIVIGLGGTGGNVINKLKHKLYDNENANIEYFYIDSNFELVDKDTHLWKAFGTDISLKPYNKYRLSSSHLSDIFDFSQNRISQKYAKWAGDIKDWQGIANQLGDSKNSAVYGEQRRRLGRMLLAGHIDEIVKKINILVRKLNSQNRNNSTTFHICVGLSGGTGSGTFIDVLAKLKEAFAGNNDNFILYLFLPEDNPNHGKVQGGNYFTNAYAALRELNALYNKQWLPYDIEHGNRKLRNISYNTPTYIITDSNDNGCFLSTEYRQPENMIADFIHLRVSNPNYSGALTAVENVTTTAEQEDNQPARSRDFFSFGIKRVIYPKQEIEKYLIYQILHKVTLALRFNQWDSQEGYVDVQNIRNTNIFGKDLMKQFHMNPLSLLLAEGALENENNWKDFKEDWRYFIQVISEELLKDEPKKKKIINKLMIECEDIYQNLYREDGVVSFFESATRQIPERVRFISQTIQKVLIGKWQVGEISLPQIEQVLDEIIQELQKIKAKFTESHKKLDDQIAKSNENVTFWKEKLEKTVLFSDKEYSNTLSHLEQLYIAKTYNEAYPYGDDLLDALINNVQGIKVEYGNLTSYFETFSENFYHSYREQLDDGHIINYAIEKIYDKTLVNELAKLILTNKNQMDAFKNDISQIIQARDGFFDLNKLFNEEYTLSNMETSIKSRLDGVVQNIATTQPRFNILNKNIVQELGNRYSNNQTQLDDYMENLILESKFYLPFNATETKNQMSNGIRILNYTSEKKFILYPNRQGINSQNILTLFDPDEIQPRNDGLDNELTVVQIQPAFPLRYIEKLNGKYGDKYKDRYNNRKESEVDVQVHLEHGRKFYNSILRPSDTELLEKTIHKLFILNALKMIKDDKQLGGLYIEIYQGNKLSDYLILKDNFRKAHENLNFQSDIDSGKDTPLDTVVSEIDLMMKEKLDEVKGLDYVPKENKQKELIDAIDKKYEEIEEFYKKNDVAKIPFWGKQAQLAIKVIEDL